MRRILDCYNQLRPRMGVEEVRCGYLFSHSALSHTPGVSTGVDCHESSFQLFSSHAQDSTQYSKE